jgi:hypothetical protein
VGLVIKQNLADTLFAGRDFMELHDVLAEIEDREYTKEECRAAFLRLPYNIQAIAVSWGLDDTVFRDEAYVFLRDNKELQDAAA